MLKTPPLPPVVAPDYMPFGARWRGIGWELPFIAKNSKPLEPVQGEEPALKRSDLLKAIDAPLPSLIASAQKLKTSPEAYLTGVMKSLGLDLKIRRVDVMEGGTNIVFTRSGHSFELIANNAQGHESPQELVRLGDVAEALRGTQTLRWPEVAPKSDDQKDEFR